VDRTLSPFLPKAVIFDMDGLIFDTEVLYQKALLGLAQERALTSIKQAIVDQTVGLSWNSTRQLLARELPSHVDTDEFIEAWTAKYETLAERSLALKPGVVELLDVLDMHGIPRAVATGSYREVAMRHLTKFELHRRFGTIVAKEDCVNGKPAPDPFLTSAARLQVDPASCWALEDSRNGIRSAHDAGMCTIMVPDILLPDEDTRELCYHIANSLSEVACLIKERGS
jgi:HAD superfamily hydrolase (TIGR01509 family)